MIKSKSVLFIILFLFSLSVIYFNRSKPVLLFKNYISEALGPIEIILSKTKNKFLFFPIVFWNIKNLKELNMQLTSENLELYGKLAKLSLLEEENTLLREKLNLAGKNHWNTNIANIIGRDFENNRSFLVDMGDSSGITAGMPVITTGEVIVGKIVDVSSKTSKVRTVIDVQSKIAAVTSDSKASGLIRGLGSDIIFDLITKNNMPKPGELIISSGTDGLWPRGLLIGKIKDVHLEEGQIFNTADVELLINFEDLSRVLIIGNLLNLR